jgi:cytoskeletal protein CcmA (bactofilin family)
MFNSKKENKTASTANSTELRNIIGKGTVITGDIETVGNIRIDGRLKGNLRCEAKVVLGEECKIEGDVFAQNAEIEGNVIGTLRIQDLLILKATARVVGDIYTARLVVESGALFNGSCKMGEQNTQTTADASKKQTAKTA